MHKGRFLHNNWVVGALALMILTAVIGFASLGDGVSLKAGGVQMTLDVAAQDGVMIRFVNAG